MLDFKIEVSCLVIVWFMIYVKFCLFFNDLMIFCIFSLGILLGNGLFSYCFLSILVIWLFWILVNWVFGVCGKLV